MKGESMNEQRIDKRTLQGKTLPRRILSLILAATMTLAMMPGMVWAAESEADGAEETQTAAVGEVVATVEIDGETTEYKIDNTYTTAEEALRAAWNDAVNGSSVDKPATLTLLTSVDLVGPYSLTMISGNVILKMKENVTMSGAYPYGLLTLGGGTLKIENGRIINSQQSGDGCIKVINAFGATEPSRFFMTGGEVKATGGNRVSGIFIDNNAEAIVDISGGKVSGSYSGVWVDQAGKVKVSGTADISCENADGQGVYFSNAKENSKIEVIGGTITGGKDSGSYGIYLGAASANISGGTISGVGLTDSKSEVIISGGEIRGKIFVNSGSLSISNCKVISESVGVAVDSGGKATISDGVRIEYGGLTYNCGVYAGTNGQVTIEPGVTVENSKYNGYNAVRVQNGKANIYGGSFTGSKNGLIIQESGTATLSGGTFTGGVGLGYGSINCNDGNVVAGLLSENCHYFSGTAVSNTTKIRDEIALSKSSLSTADGYGTVTVGKETVNITEPAQPRTYNLEVGYTENAPELTVTAQKEGDVSGDIAYQWYQKKDDGETAVISGATESSYQVPTGLAGGEYEYYCVVTCGSYSAVSETATVHVAKKTRTVTISELPGKTYDGQPVSVSYNLSEKTATDKVSVEFKKQGDSSYTTEAPKNAGSYTVRVTAEANDTYDEAVATADFTINPKKLTVTVKVKDKQYDGTNTAEIESATLEGVISGDDVTLTNGTPIFTTTDVGNNIPIQFNSIFAISGTTVGNYTLTQPTDVKASIKPYTAVEGTDYTVNSNDGWLNKGFVVTAKEGYLVSTSNADDEWTKTISDSDEIKDGDFKFYVKNASGIVSEAVTYKIDKTAPNGTVTVGEDSANTWTELQTGITFDQTFKEKQSVTLAGEDGFSGIESVEYFLADKELSMDELNAATWTVYDKPFSLEKSGKYVVYVKITDKAGNETMISSGGITLDIPSSSHYPSAPTDNVINSGTSGTDSATTTANLNTTETGGTANAVVDQTTADKIVEKATSNKSAEVVIDATTRAGKAETTTVTIPTDTVQKIADKTEAEVTLKTDAAKMTLDQKSFGTVAAKATGSTVEIIVEKTKDETKYMEFELKIVSGGVVIGEFDGGNVKVTVKLNAALAALKNAELTCVHIDDNGIYSKVKGAKNDDGTYTFITTHFSSYAIMAETEADKIIDEQTIETVKKTMLVARSANAKAPSGKKAIKVYWFNKDGSKLNFDGYEIYRSTKKNKFSKKPIFVAKKTAYFNTSAKKGTRYYYKVRGYKIISGKKVYTPYSLKAIRTAK